jgi:DNA-binding protein Fis
MHQGAGQQVIAGRLPGIDRKTLYLTLKTYDIS